MFWVCVVCFFINMFLFFVSEAVGDPGMQAINLMSAFCLALGALSNWYLERIEK